MTLLFKSLRLFFADFGGLIKQSGRLFFLALPFGWRALIVTALVLLGMDFCWSWLGRFFAVGFFPFFGVYIFLFTIAYTLFDMAVYNKLLSRKKPLAWGDIFNWSGRHNRYFLCFFLLSIFFALIGTVFFLLLRVSDSSSHLFLLSFLLATGLIIWAGLSLLLPALALQASWQMRSLLSFLASRRGVFFIIAFIIGFVVVFALAQMALLVSTVLFPQGELFFAGEAFRIFFGLTVILLKDCLLFVVFGQWHER